MKLIARLAFSLWSCYACGKGGAEDGPPNGVCPQCGSTNIWYGDR